MLSILFPLSFPIRHPPFISCQFIPYKMKLSSLIDFPFLRLGWFFQVCHCCCKLRPFQGGLVSQRKDRPECRGREGRVRKKEWERMKLNSRKSIFWQFHFAHTLDLYNTTKDFHEPPKTSNFYKILQNLLLQTFNFENSFGVKYIWYTQYSL